MRLIAAEMTDGPLACSTQMANRQHRARIQEGCLGRPTRRHLCHGATAEAERAWPICRTDR